MLTLWMLFLRFLMNAAVGTLVGVSVWVAPLTELFGYYMVYVQTPLAVLILTCTIGKALYDTLFWDRYFR
jgi:hypothetical protein